MFYTQPAFTRCSCESVRFSSEGIIYNPPINLAFCVAVIKSEYIGISFSRPSIKFTGCDIEWVYKNEGDRDRDFIRIVDR
jgi:hypothetical protein